jgi:hypothetical protein
MCNAVQMHNLINTFREDSEPMRNLEDGIRALELALAAIKSQVFSQKVDMNK